MVFLFSVSLLKQELADKITLFIENFMEARGIIEVFRKVLIRPFEALEGVISP